MDHVLVSPQERDGDAGHGTARGKAARKRLAERHIELQLSDDALAHLVQSGYDPTYGARPLKRAIQREVETPLARRLLAGDIRDYQTIRTEVVNGKLIFEPAKIESHTSTKQGA